MAVFRQENIAMFRAAFVATIGLFALSGVATADPLVDAFVQGFEKGKQPKPKCDTECFRSTGGSLGSVPAGSWQQQQRTAPTESGKTGITNQTRPTTIKR
jgi:hypothetical protein